MKLVTLSAIEKSPPHISGTSGLYRRPILLGLGGNYGKIEEKD